MRDGAGRSRCFAFLTFEKPASVNAVMVRWMGKSLVLHSPFLSLPRKLSPTSLSILRSTRKEPSRDKNTNAPPSCSSVDWRAASLPRACASLFPSLGKLLIRRLCWTVRRDGVKGLGSFRLRIRTFNPFSSFWALGIWKLMASWYVSPFPSSSY